MRTSDNIFDDAVRWFLSLSLAAVVSEWGDMQGGELFWDIRRVDQPNNNALHIQAVTTMQCCNNAVNTNKCE